MKYRVLPHGGEQISVLGIGASSIQASDEKEIEETICLAVENGINFFDMASSEAKPFAAYGRALAQWRKNVYFQIHFGANYETGTYGWTTDLDTIKRSIDRQLKALQTDYIDFGFIHCIDDIADLDQIEKAGVIRYIEKLKAQGVVRHIGLSSHTPNIVNKVLDMGVLDMLMFSINPAYDYTGGDEVDYSTDNFAVGSVRERMNLYRRCEAEGVGISVMKPFSGGQLLNAETSPFQKALTEYQCIQYALDKPAVMTALCGIRGKEDIIRDVNPEISDDEARTITVQHILLRTWMTDGSGTRVEYAEDVRQSVYAKVCGIREMAVEGEQDFLELASRYSDEANITVSFGKGEMDPAFEEAAFSLATNEVSQVVETKDGYHIIKCINTFDREQTDLSKLEIVEERRREVFGEEYDAFAETLVRQLNTKLWNEITLIHNEELDTVEFFDIYEKYFADL